MHSGIRILVLFLILSIHTISVFAQNDEASLTILPSCSTEEFDEGIANFISFGASITELTQEYALAADPNDENYAEAILGMDEISANVWTEAINELPQCFELQWVGYLFAGTYDHLLISMLMKNAYAWSDPESEAAELYAQQAETHTEIAQQYQIAIASMISDPTQFELPECTSDEFDTLASAFEEIATGVSSGFLSYMNEGQFVEFFTYVDGQASLYANEIFPQVSACQETAIIAMDFRSALDELSISAGLIASSDWESERNEEISDALYTSAVQHSATSEQWNSLAQQLGVEIPTGAATEEAES